MTLREQRGGKRWGWAGIACRTGSLSVGGGQAVPAGRDAVRIRARRRSTVRLGPSLSPHRRPRGLSAPISLSSHFLLTAAPSLFLLTAAPSLFLLTAAQGVSRHCAPASARTCTRGPPRMRLRPRAPQPQPPCVLLRLGAPEWVCTQSVTPVRARALRLRARAPACAHLPAPVTSRLCSHPAIDPCSCMVRLRARVLSRAFREGSCVRGDHGHGVGGGGGSGDAWGRVGAGDETQVCH